MRTVAAFLVPVLVLVGENGAATTSRTVGPFTVTFYNSGDKYTDSSGYTYTGARNWTATEMDDTAAMIQVWDNKIDNPYGPRQIKMYAMWSNLGSGVLGSSLDGFAYTYTKAWTCGEYVWRQGVNYANSYADVFYQYGTGFTWHTGSDSPGSGEYDFRSVVCHEVGHTLGFNGTYSYSTDRWSSSGITEWDSRLRDARTGGNRPVAGGKGTPHNFNQTANPCYWDGNYSKVANGGNRIPVYAPSPFDSGSSLYHLNDANFPDALMKHAIGSGQGVREPSPIEWEMMKDLGWSVITDRTWSKGAGTMKWTAAANWALNGAPDRTNRVIFTDAGLTGGDTIDLDGNRTIDSLRIDGNVSFTIGGAVGILTLNKGNVTRTGASSGIQTIGRPVALAAGGVWDIGGTGELVVSSRLITGSSGSIEKRGTGTLTISATQDYGPGSVLTASAGTVNMNTDGGGADPNKYWRLSVNVTGSGSVLNVGASQHLAAVNLNAGGGARVSGGGNKVLVARALSIDSNNSRLDLTDNDAIVDYQGGNTPFNQVSAWIAQGFNGGDWLGNGITSAETANPAYGGLAGIGFADNSQGLTGEFSGQTVDDSAVLVKFTWYGDADLNGAVNTDDFGLWVAGFSGDPGTSPTWLYGDFDYNGAVNTDDFALWAYAFDGQTTVLSEGFGAAVPEPGTLVLLAVGGLGLLRRARKIGTHPIFRHRGRNEQRPVPPTPGTRADGSKNRVRPYFSGRAIRMSNGSKRIESSTSSSVQSKNRLLVILYCT